MSSFKNQYDPLEFLIFNKGLRIKDVHIHQDLDLMLIVLNNGKVMRRCITQFPTLKSATEEALSNFRLIGKGVGIHWPQLDEDMSLKNFLQEELTQFAA